MSMTATGRICFRVQSIQSWEHNSVCTSDSSYTSPSLTLVMIDHNYGDDRARSLGTTRILEEDFSGGQEKLIDFET